MPEGDTVHNLAAHLRPVLVGRVLTACDIRVPRFAAVDLTGRTVDTVTARGKHLLFAVGGAVIHSHLKMEGDWQVHRTGERWRRPAHTARAVLAVDGAQVVGFSLGILEILTPAEADGALAHLGPDPLGPDWDPAVAATNLAAEPGRPVGLALLDQRNLAGVGNVYRNELCFLRGVHPAIPVGECGDMTAWVEEAARLLRANLGRSRRVTTGVDRNGMRHFVYDRARRPCLRCGSAIRVGSLGGAGDPERSIQWCPRCQPQPAGNTQE
ncbi:Fpg/Nei family DNA glycosylase [Tsukamurella pseudospumae]|uniref:DNA-(apurinic or apyrimidinic site) lyase n=1 Tax=Tsukamurella pseudospumae TaxID=239498 RepID=A0A137ZYV9_9ACTN|nr:DNA-formamidopyrimidine glycosylase family protein [Tsukamurella pseudospumae]KXO97907.1 DNA glycosylase [Tsukamurella pseudospumae]KXP03380.1 DNA glycosylase [Tsukamurella pseudospumae]